MEAEVRTGAPVASVERTGHGVQVRAHGAEPEQFDHVVFATHSDQSLGMLADPRPDEQWVLERVRYKPNRAILHTDASVMPKRRACWSSWVYQASRNGRENAASVTYWMNNLQGLDQRTQLFITLNPPHDIPEDKILDEHICDHPQFDLPAHTAQAELPRVQGRRNTWFCGAWTRNGFHEDGLASAVEVASRLGVTPPWAQ